jgi:hypothetical protein
MSVEANTETDRTPKGILLNTAKVIQFARDYLDKASDETSGYDPGIVRHIHVERKALEAFLTQLTQTLMITDNDLFTEAVGALKLQVPSLHAVSDQIKSIASDTATPPGVGGHMEQSVTYIAQAILFIAELP